MTTFNCDNTTITTDSPPPHLWICCGFETLPTVIEVTWVLEGTDPGCLATFGASGTATLTRSACGSNYTNPGYPFYIAVPTPQLYCFGDPHTGGNGHIGAWGAGPGSATYDAGNGCTKNSTTGVVTFTFTAYHVGSGGCLFTITVTSIS